MDKNLSEQLVKEHLQSLGLVVSKIKSSTQGKTPDYLVSYEEEKFLIEVKNREKDENFNTLIESPYPGKESQELGYSNTISGIIEDGIEQLIEYDSDNKFLHILWCSTINLIHGNLVARQFVDTAYGLKNIEGYDKNNNFFETVCFYFGYNNFFGHRNLDALVVQSPNKITLCLNSFSETINQFKTSALYNAFKKADLEIIDPKNLEENGGYFFMDTNIDRKNTNAVLAYIEEKYELQEVTPINFVLFNLPV